MSSATTPATISGRRHAALVKMIALLQQDGTTARAFEGTSYTGSDLPRLYRLEELLAVKAAIAAITGGAQSYEIEGLVYTRATLFQLQAREEDLEKKAGRRKRGGIGMRFGVPF